MGQAKKRRKSPKRKKRKKAVVKKASSSSLFSFQWMLPGGTALWLYEVLAVLCAATSLFFLASFFSHVFSYSNGGGDIEYYGHLPTANIMGPVGHFIGTMLEGFLGWCGLLPALWAAAFSYYFWLHTKGDGQTEFEISSRWMLFIGIPGSVIGCSALAGVLGGRTAGGKIGELVGNPLVKYFNVGGATLFSVALLLLFLGFAFQKSSLILLKDLSLAVMIGARLIFVVCPLICFSVVSALLGYSYKGLQVLCRNVLELELPSFLKKKKSEEKVLPKPRRRKNTVPVEDSAEELHTHVVVERRKRDPRALERLNRSNRKGKHSGKKRAKPEEDRIPYDPPPLSLLALGETSDSCEDDEALLKKSVQICKKLKDFGISGRVTHVHPGPVITLFEFEPAPGVKVGKIASLQDDLAMTLRASSIRIIAPIPKRGTVGIEVPNKQRDLVRLRDVLESEAFVNAESILSVCIGKDIYGDPLVVDISRMPHLLMAGATGTGKSVSINALLLSMLYRATPEELGLILIDPKILELSVYEGIPHLKVPVVTAPRQARAVLEWAAREMEKRYRLLHKYGVRSIDGYNRIALGDAEKNDKNEVIFSELINLGEEDIIEEGTDEGLLPPEEEIEGLEQQFAEKIEPLPKIVIVIDELADLMLTVGKEIEELITRLAQKARAAGIHLILATQRPSVDVITGLIKANFPARMSFRVSSRIDSRTILDSMGAEKLLGRGDMLLMLPGAEHVKRAHGAYVSDAEVTRVANALKEKFTTHYDSEIVEICEKALEEDAADANSSLTSEVDYDSYYDKAVELVVEKGQASTSMIQRAFRIGYNRAARIIDTMEQEGIIGPINGAKPREILLERNDYSME